jgi:hypothetical protein
VVRSLVLVRFFVFPLFFVFLMLCCLRLQICFHRVLAGVGLVVVSVLWFWPRGSWCGGVGFVAADLVLVGDGCVV